MALSKEQREAAATRIRRELEVMQVRITQVKDDDLSADLEASRNRIADAFEPLSRELGAIKE